MHEFKHTNRRPNVRQSNLKYLKFYLLSHCIISTKVADWVNFSIFNGIPRKH